MAQLALKIPAHLNPAYLDAILAKSENNGGDTLAQHTWLVLCRLADQYRLRGERLAVQLEDERLWHRLYWGCFLHDFGKAARGFQERLQRPPVENEWATGRHRHEVLSLAFVDAVFPRGHQDRLAVISIVIAHHKDFAASASENDDITIRGKYGGAHRDDHQRKRVDYLMEQLATPLIADLWRWLDEFGEVWARELGIPVEPLTVRSQIALSADNIVRALEDFGKYFTALQDGDVAAKQYERAILYRGLILTADHAASAGAPEFPPLTLTHEAARRPLQGKTPRDHQVRASEAAPGSTILIAPTGSGKTEAALLWAARQLEHAPAARLFYTLPYQASMNAMVRRLSERFLGEKDWEKSDQVMIQHSRATLQVYQAYMEEDGGANPRQQAQQAKARANLSQLRYFPMQVFSPYQMLKAGYQLKAYETLLVDFAGALFIFDEIHAYEAGRLALIITMMRWLREQYGARFLVMTATLPPLIKEKLLEALALTDAEILRADDATFQESQRHVVHFVEGSMLDSLERIAEDGRQGKAVLVCCNQVARAQTVYKALRDEHGFIPDENLMLLHGRFNGADRAAKEARLLDAVGVGAQNRRTPYIVVATQVVEVSLDIDLDTLYTDPAPLEALLQRFGRVNRGRAERTLCPAHVFRQPADADGARPYDLPLIEASLRVLEHYCAGKPIDEALVTQMLEDIYQDEAIAGKWRAEYDGRAREFRQTLRDMMPFESADDKLECAFYENFDGVQVLPMECANDYHDARESKSFLDATRYFVNLSWRQYYTLKNRDLVIRRGENEYVDQVNVHYDSEMGLDIEGALGAKDDDL